MYIKVRTIDAKNQVVLDISKTTSIVELKKLLEQQFDIEPENQRLFFRGKQLEDEYTLFDYNINLNDMVQIMEKVSFDCKDGKQQESGSKDDTSTPDEGCSEHVSQDSEGSLETSKYFQVGEYVDFRDETYGAWFEGRLTKIIKDDGCGERDNSEGNELNEDPENYIYEVVSLEDETSVVKVSLQKIRPRARNKIPYKDLKVGDKVTVNYNIEEPDKDGFWYDAIVTQLKSKKTDALIVDLMVGDTTLKDCKIMFKNEIMKIEDTKPLNERELCLEKGQNVRELDIPVNCEHCNNNARRKCKECGCHVCGLKTDENKQIMCDECDYAYHIWCLTPPLEKIPDDDEWYCHECKNDENEIVAAGGKLKESKKRAKMASKINNTTRDWGKGMACVARTKSCTIVPFDHFGPIPGIEVGTQWKFRIQASEAGVHRPHVAGIHGRENIGAFSVVLSGGYEDDVDNGDEVYYTGSGGRDLSGNKRTNAQGFDQTLSRFNKALALNCNVPLNEKGAEARDWRGGKPVRVIRNYKLAKHSKYAPVEGNRYDGIYKVVKYFPKKGKSGFTVWRFLFRRDDPAPAPWTKAGKEHMESLGLEMQYPEGYLEAQAANKKIKDSDNNPETPKSRGKKRVLTESPNPQPQAATKKAKLSTYKLEVNVSIAIQKDRENVKLWTECRKELIYGKPKFLSKVEEIFMCICCTELVLKPVTTPCKHNFCAECLKRSFNAEVMTCPTCRAPLDKDVLKHINEDLQSALNVLFPGYTGSR